MSRRLILSIAVLIIALAVVVVHRRAGQAFSEKSSVSPALLIQARTDALINRKFLMVQFGADWCGDCVELSKALHQNAMQAYLEEQFIVLKVDVGEFNRNLDIAKSVGIDVLQEIPTAVFFPPSGSQPVTKRGTRQILTYVRETAEQQ